MKKLLNKLNIFKRLRDAEKSLEHFRLVEKGIYESNDSFRDKIDYLISQNDSLSRQNNFIMKATDIGVDVHMKSNSWAVICINGKQEYVKFFEIPTEEDARQLRVILKDFERANLIVDSNPMFSQMFREGKKYPAVSLIK